MFEFLKRCLGGGGSENEVPYEHMQPGTPCLTEEQADALDRAKSATVAKVEPKPVADDAPPYRPEFDITVNHRFKYDFHGVETDRLKDVAGSGFDFFVNVHCEDRTVAVRKMEIWIYKRESRKEETVILNCVGRLSKDDFDGATRWLRGAHSKLEYGGWNSVGLDVPSEPEQKPKFSDEEYAEMYARLLRSNDRISKKLKYHKQEFETMRRAIAAALAPLEVSLIQAVDMHNEHVERMARFAAKIGNLDRNVPENGPDLDSNLKGPELHG